MIGLFIHIDCVNYLDMLDNQDKFKKKYQDMFKFFIAKH